MPDFIVYALCAGFGVTLMSGPLGSFAVWRKMSYFGDTLAHSALTGVALGLMLSLNIGLAVTAVCLFVALLLVWLQQGSEIAADTLLGILSHSMLALGLVLVSTFGAGQLDLYGFLFGDLLAVDASDLVTIAITAAIILPLLVLLWRPLIFITLHEDLAQVEGIRVIWVRVALMLMMAGLIAVAMKIVGVLLITALLIIPAAASRRIATSPEQMAAGASILGMTAIAGGLALSFWLDTPAGPSTVLCASALFLLSLSLTPRA